MLTTPPLTQLSSTPSSSTSSTVAAATVRLDNKIKIEPQFGLLQGASSSSASGSIIMIPSVVQSDGNIAYTIQDTSSGKQPPQRNISIIQPPVLSTPVKQNQKLPMLMPKVILPKNTTQPSMMRSMSSNAQSSIVLPVNPVIKSAQTMINRAQPAAGTSVVRRVQLVSDGQIRNIDIVQHQTGENSVRSDKPLTPLELKHVQSIMQHKRDDRDRS